MYFCTRCGKCQKRRPATEAIFNINSRTDNSYKAVFCRKCRNKWHRLVLPLNRCWVIPYNNGAPNTRATNSGFVVVPVSATRIRVNLDYPDCQATVLFLHDILNDIE